VVKVEAEVGFVGVAGDVVVVVVAADVGGMGRGGFVGVGRGGLVVAVRDAVCGVVEDVVMVWALRGGEDEGSSHCVAGVGASSP